MTDLFKLILGILASRFKARATLEADNLVLRQQVNVLRRRTPKRPHLNNTDRFLFVWLYRWFPSVLEVVAIVRPETIIRWHRAGFRTYWRWRSRNRVGRPRVSAELRTLIGEMSRANALWGAARRRRPCAHGIHRERWAVPEPVSEQSTQHLRSIHRTGPDGPRSARSKSVNRDGLRMAGLEKGAEQRAAPNVGATVPQIARARN